MVALPCSLDPAEAVSLVLSCVAAYQMLERIVRAREDQRVLVHKAGGGAGTALLRPG